MNNLIALFGFPGAGKTTLANTFIGQHTEYKHHDILTYIDRYKNSDGTLKSEEYTLNAYQEMYDELGAIVGNVILEAGTNHASLNIRKLKDLSSIWKVIIMVIRSLRNQNSIF